MNINWQNLSNLIQNGQTAFQGSGFGSSEDRGTISIYDHPMSDLGEAAIEHSRNNPNIFSFGSSQWGQSDVVDE